VRKTLWTLNIDDYAPDLTAWTYPLMRKYAAKIDADFRIITERRFPDWPVVYEKLQIHELGRGNDWNIYIDSDALIHPDFFDVTEFLPRDTVMHNGRDLASNRWRYDDYFRRDGRHIGSCNWFTVASSWCLDLWEPLEMSFAEAVENITLSHGEVVSDVMDRGHLIDDYTLSRNIAKYGLKFQTLIEMKQGLQDNGEYLWHIYTDPLPKKIVKTFAALVNWNIDPDDLLDGRIGPVRDRTREKVAGWKDDFPAVDLPDFSLR
jgi:hypothetical protein